MGLSRLDVSENIARKRTHFRYAYANILMSLGRDGLSLPQVAAGVFSPLVNLPSRLKAVNQLLIKAFDAPAILPLQPIAHYSFIGSHHDHLAQ